MTPARKEINRLIPKFSKYIRGKANVLSVGVDRVYDYSEYFKNCNYKTMDINSKTNPDFVGDIQDSEFSDEYWDAIIMIGVYEYLTDKKKAFQEINRILKYNGRAFIAVPGEGYYPEGRKIVKIKDIHKAVEPLQVADYEVINYRGVPNYIVIYAWRS